MSTAIQSQPQVFLGGTDYSGIAGSELTRVIITTVCGHPTCVMGEPCGVWADIRDEVEEIEAALIDDMPCACSRGPRHDGDCSDYCGRCGMHFDSHNGPDGYVPCEVI